MTASTNLYTHDTRPPAVAGYFYPHAPGSLRDTVSSYLEAAGEVNPPPKAVIAPHAGYIYSGQVAASAYAGWRSLGETVNRVVLLGPSHQVYLRGLAAPSVRGFETPLGTVPLDAEAIETVASLPQVTINDHPHALEHSLEVHLPFLQMLFPEFKLVPLAVGDTPARDVEAVLETLWNGPETRVVISSDLSHYHSYDEARAIDAATAAAIVAGRTEELGPEQACGFIPIRGLLGYVRRHNLRVTELDRCNSGDTAGPRDHVVGYGAYAVMQAD